MKIFWLRFFFLGWGRGGNSKTFSKDYFWGSGGIEILGKYLKISLTQQPAKKMTYPPLVMDKYVLKNKIFSRKRFVRIYFLDPGVLRNNRNMI